NPYAYTMTFNHVGDGIIAPAIMSDHGEIILCKGWLSKKWHQTKKFVKKHKKAIIIGAVVVVAAVVTYGIFAAPAWLAAGAAADSPENKSRRSEPSTTHGDTSMVPMVMEEQVANFKENLSKEGFFQPTSSLAESGRIAGSLLAHDSFNELSSWMPEPNTPAFGHHEVDKGFSTNYASIYADPARESDFNTLSYQLRGEKALSTGNFTQAVHDFDKAIE